MRCDGHALSLALVVLLCACSGGGSTAPPTTIPQANSPVNAPSGNVQSVQLGLQPMSATLPVVAQITGTLLFPAVRIPATLSLSGSATAPAGVTVESLRRAQSGTLTVYEYVTIVSPITTSLPSLPAMTLQFPASTPLAGKSVYYGISDLNAQGGLVSFNTQGPGTIDGQTVSFAPVPTPITYEAGHKYTSVVYATGTAVKVGATKIYVTNAGNNTVTTYNADGTQTTPTISAGLNFPFAVAVDAAGRIYVVNLLGKNVTTYNANGTQTTLRIAAELTNPGGIAIDAAGKIYVSNYYPRRTVTTYKADGTPTKPTITAGLNNPTAVAVDAAGKIYVLNSGNSTLTTYKTDGTPTKPTITAQDSSGNLTYPSSVAVDAAGKIYLVTRNIVTTYTPDGTPTAPSIITSDPLGVAVDTAGKIYVLNGITTMGTFDTVTAYNPDGIASAPTISAGLSDSKSITVH